MGNFKAKRQNTKVAISPKLKIRSRSNLRSKLRPIIALLGCPHITEIKFNMAACLYLKIWITPPWFDFDEIG